VWDLLDHTDRPPQVLITQMNISSTCWAWPPFHNSPRFRSRASRWDGLLTCCSSATRWACITDLPVLKRRDGEVFEMMIFIQLLFRFFTPSLSFSSRADVLWIIAFYVAHAQAGHDRTPLFYVMYLNIKELLSKFASK